MIYGLVVYLKPPTKNDIKPDMGLFRMGGRMVPAAWVRVKKLEVKWARCIRPASGPERAAGPRRVSFTRVMGPRERPYDLFNLVTGLNAVVMDELVRKGWLLDDNPSCVELPMPTQRRATPVETAPATLILIEDVEIKPIKPSLPAC